MAEVIKPALALVVIAIICALCLGFTHEITLVAIEEAELKAKNEALFDVVPGANAFVPCAFEENNVPGYDAYITEIMTAEDAYGEIIGYCVFTETNGYGGSMAVLTAIDTNGVILGVSVVKNSETPGLGTLATQEPFIGRYNGKTGVFSVNGADIDANAIEAVTGATISSNAVTNSVNAAVNYHNIYLMQGSEF